MIQMKDKIVPFTCSGKWVRCLQGHVKVAKVTSYSVKYMKVCLLKCKRPKNRLY